MIIDTHAHLYLKDFDQDIEEVVERAKSTGVRAVFLPNINSETVDAMFALCDRYPDFFFPMMGLHPVYVKASFREELERIFHRIDERKIFAIGEIGTDAHWDKSFLKEQEEAFHIQCGWSLQKDLPIVVHSRDSMDWQIEMVKSYGGKLRGIFHCFTGTKSQAEEILDLGFSLGIGGVVTFKNSNLSEVLEYVPIRSIVLETDSPYLAPSPKRGKRNESGYLKYIVIKLAEIYRMKEEEVKRVTSANAENIFERRF